MDSTTSTDHGPHAETPIRDDNPFHKPLLSTVEGGGSPSSSSVLPRPMPVVMEVEEELDLHSHSHQDNSPPHPHPHGKKYPHSSFNSSSSAPVANASTATATPGQDGRWHAGGRFGATESASDTERGGSTTTTATVRDVHCIERGEGRGPLAPGGGHVAQRDICHTDSSNDSDEARQRQEQQQSSLSQSVDEETSRAGRGTHFRDPHRSATATTTVSGSSGSNASSGGASEHNNPVADNDHHWRTQHHSRPGQGGGALSGRGGGKKPLKNAAYNATSHDHSSGREAQPPANHGPETPPRVAQAGPELLDVLSLSPGVPMGSLARFGSTATATTRPHAAHTTRAPTIHLTSAVGAPHTSDITTSRAIISLHRSGATGKGGAGLKLPRAMAGGLPAERRLMIHSRRRAHHRPHVIVGRASPSRSRASRGVLSPTLPDECFRPLNAPGGGYDGNDPFNCSLHSEAGLQHSTTTPRRAPSAGIGPTSPDSSLVPMGSFGTPSRHRDAGPAAMRLGPLDSETPSHDRSRAGRSSSRGSSTVCVAVMEDRDDGEDRDDSDAAGLAHRTLSTGAAYVARTDSCSSLSFLESCSIPRLGGGLLSPTDSCIGRRSGCGDGFVLRHHDDPPSMTSVSQSLQSVSTAGGTSFCNRLVLPFTTSVPIGPSSSAPAATTSTTATVSSARTGLLSPSGMAKAAAVFPPATAFQLSGAPMSAVGVAPPPHALASRSPTTPCDGVVRNDSSLLDNSVPALIPRPA